MAILRLGDGEGEVVTATLRVTENQGRKAGSGTITGSAGLLVKAFNAGQATITFRDGPSAQIMVTEVSANGAAFQTSGPVTGI